MSERPSHHDLQLLLGAYVLGGLSSDDRRRLELHLPDCAACTTELSRYAGVPGLLQLAPPGTTVDEAPPESLPRLLDAARARREARRRRRWLLTAAAVLVVLAGLVGEVLAVTGWGGAGGVAEPQPTDVVVVFNDATVGQAVLAPKAWGTEVRLDLDYPPRGKQPYTAWAVARDGHQEQAATWTTPADGHCQVTGATSITRDALDHVEVRTADGRTLLRTR